MIQELLGGSSASLIGGERNISHSSSPAATSPASEKPNQNQNQNQTQTQTQNQNQNLRCPRCDSSNTKFCYYNNYNLTQPRHFCKTCRRYWTKGGALRNVPIGGGCRRSKNVTITSHMPKPNSGVRLKNTLSCEIGKLGFEGYNGNNHDQLFASNPILWAPSQSAHILSLLRSNQNPNPNPTPNLNPSCAGMKEESVMSTTQALGLGQFNPFWRSNQGQGEQSGFVIGNEIHSNAGIGQDLYQRLRSTGNYYQDHHHHSPMPMSSGVATSSTPCSVLESAPVASGAVSSDLGYWNPTANWSDLPTTNGAYH